MTRSFNPLVSGLLCAVMAFGPATAQPTDLSGATARPAINRDVIDRLLAAAGGGDVADYGCSGLFCTCDRGSHGCDIIEANSCADPLVCVGDDCSCVNGTVD